MANIKLSLDEVAEVASSSLKDKSELPALLKKLQELADEKAKEKEENKADRVKKVLTTIQAEDKDTCWVLEIEEDFDVATVEATILAAIADFNATKKGSKKPIVTIGDAFQSMAAKFWKARKLNRKTKEPVYISSTTNTIKKV